MAAAAGVSFGGASSLAALAVSDATAFSAAFFFFFPDLGFAEVFNSVRISVSEMNNLLLDLLLVYIFPFGSPNRIQVFYLIALTIYNFQPLPIALRFQRCDVQPINVRFNLSCPTAQLSKD